MDAVYENVVRFAETDAQGIVFYGNYVEYQDETLTTFMFDLGYGMDADRDWDIHAVNVELNYRDSATFRDRLVHDIRVAAIHGSSIEFEYACRRPADETLVVDGSVTHVVVDESEGSPMQVPQTFRDAVVEAQAEPPNPV
jgi:acyl-CoA thioester hydrolase